MEKRSCGSPLHTRGLRIGSSSRQLPGRRVARLPGGPSTTGQQQRAQRVPAGAPGLIIAKGSAGGRLWGKKPGGVREAVSPWGPCGGSVHGMQPGPGLRGAPAPRGRMMDEEPSSLPRSTTSSHAVGNPHPSQQHLPQISKWKVRGGARPPGSHCPRATVSPPALPLVSLLHCCLIRSEMWGKAGNRRLTALSCSTSVYPLDLNALN